MPGKAVVAGEHDDEWLRNHTPVNQIVRPLFRPHERGVKPAPHQGVSEVRGILARDRDLYTGQFIVKDAHRFRQPIYFLPREDTLERRSAWRGEPPAALLPWLPLPGGAP